MTPHTHTTRIYYDATDAGGLVYHAAYLALAEHARTEALRAAGLPHTLMQAEHGVSFIVRRLDIAYMRPARLDDLLAIRTAAVAATAATVTLDQRFSRGDVELARLRVVLACIRPDGRPARIPPRWRALLSPALEEPRAP